MQKIIKYGFIILSFLIVNISSVNAQAGKKYIDKYKTLVASLSEEYGIPKSIITAISIVESGLGKSRNCKLLKNHFGIVGKNNLLKTKGIKSMFKQYKTDEDSFKDFCKIISRKKFYPKLKGNNDYKLWIEAMAKAGYSTKPKIWKKEILITIKHFKLASLDKEVKEDVTEN
ncbi:MAG: glucosaminidase domain-containing protein [Chitinophagales bacterium]|nr:glucosaminidase domain-containing protein [Chitinophagales bacterium]